jgi:Galactose oxidase, central domain
VFSSPYEGQLLLAGGWTYIRREAGIIPVVLESAERFDTASGRWSVAGAMHEGRVLHTVTTLGNGQVLVTGGAVSEDTFLASAELFDPRSGYWTKIESLNRARAGHTATLLPDGQVLVAGGQDAAGRMSSVERYDPEAKKWIASA